MKKLLLFTAVVCMATPVFSQGSGNYYFSQSNNPNFKKEYKDYDYEMNQQNYYNANYSNYNSSPTYSKGSDTVCYVIANVMMNVQPDYFVIMLGTSQVGESLEVCHQLLDQRINDFITSLGAEGIQQKDVYVDFISQAPIFSYEEEKTLFSKKYVKVPKGFELKKNIHIRYNDRKQADKIIKNAAASEIYDIIKVDYIVNDMQSILDTMRKDCIDILNKKTQEYNTLGVNAANMYRTYEESHYCYYPLQRYETFISYTPDNLKALSSTASLINENSKINLYYSKLPDNYFDKVINPDVLEPVIQYTYTVKMKTVFKKN